MTIEAWNILLSAVILVLMTGGGLWLKYVVDQQLKAKDTAIQALEGVVKFKDAHIASLQGDSAPAIAKSYAAMREHADQITKDYQSMVTEYDELKSRSHISTQLAPAQVALSQAYGLNAASDILHKHFDELLFPERKPNPLFFEGGSAFSQTICEAILNAGIEIADESTKYATTAVKIMEPFRKLLEDGHT